jgi:hypothetical protein
MSKTFTYPGSGNLTLSYDYAVETEPGFDYTFVRIDTTGTGAAPDVEAISYNGSISGSELLTLVPGTALRSTPGSFTIKFIAMTDGSYSDEDGLYPTACGHTALDDIRLTGAVSDFADFEVDAGGWTLEPVPATGIGDFTNIVHRLDLPAPNTVCPCAVQDSVLVFHDLMQLHPEGQNNLAVSPWIDLGRGGDADRTGKGVFFDVFGDLPLTNNVFYGFAVRFPEVCPVTGQLRISQWKFANGLFFLEQGFCNQAGEPRFRDLAGLIPPLTQEVQLAISVVKPCIYPPCSGLSNSSPWFDNVSLAVFGPATAPQVTILAVSDRLQDNFATDGTLSPASPGRLDIRITKSPTARFLADTLVAAGDGGNTEVRLVFKVRPGPFTNASMLAAWAAQWTTEPSIGSNWYSARMDTAEQGGVTFPGWWMGTFHESDPGFSGTDQTSDPMHPSELENEILPDGILTPGSRVEYFLASRYLPPDPRNAGGDTWFIWPDTTSARFLEAEILPSSYGPDSTWNCVLYVDKHEGQDPDGHVLEEMGLTQALGTGSSNAEGTRYDRWEGGPSFGRPMAGMFGAHSNQLAGYKAVVWHSGNLLGLTTEDVAVLTPWLAVQASVGLWIDGDAVAHIATFTPTITSFLNNQLGVLFTCDPISRVNCPSGTPFDLTTCMPLSTAAGAAFATAVPVNLNTGECGSTPTRRFDLISANPSVSGVAGQLDYLKGGVARGSASVTRDVFAFNSVFDGFSVSRLRTNTGDPGEPLDCNNTTAAILRTADVLNFLLPGLVCPAPASSVPGGGDPPLPVRHPALGNAHPNPLAPSTRISFTNAVEGGRVRIEVFDVTGRLVRTLVDGPRPAGDHEVMWDGTNDQGSTVSGGLYFYRMTAGRYSASRKVVVTDHRP